jgi:hypothetical protein
MARDEEETQSLLSKNFFFFFSCLKSKRNKKDLKNKLFSLILARNNKKES